ncbi:unnamed protein product [Oreochromis niloticus]|nr:unnamed protein product [Mustela putorius furo]
MAALKETEQEAQLRATEQEAGRLTELKTEQLTELKAGRLTELKAERLTELKAGRLTELKAEWLTELKSGLQAELIDELIMAELTAKLKIEHTKLQGFLEGWLSPSCLGHPCQTVQNRALLSDRANGLKHRQFQQFLSELESAYGDALYYTEVRWLSRGRVLKHFYELVPKINAFLHSKGKTVPELIDPEWKWHLSFLTDLTEMLNGLNLQLQDQGKLIFDMYSHIKAFKVKLALLLEQVKKHNFTHLPATQNLFAKNPAVPFPAEKCVEALEMLKAEFGVRFPQLHVHAKEIRLFQNPFVADIDEALPFYQFELAELQNCDVLKDAFKPNSLIDFYAALPNDTYPNIKKHAMKMSTLFSSTYICEQTFSRMKLLKTPMRSRLTDEHLDQCLRLAVTRMNPDIQLLTGQMQAHSSH